MHYGYPDGVTFQQPPGWGLFDEQKKVLIRQDKAFVIGLPRLGS